MPIEQGEQVAGSEMGSSLILQDNVANAGNKKKLNRIPKKNNSMMELLGFKPKVSVLPTVKEDVEKDSPAREEEKLHEEKSVNVLVQEEEVKD